MITLQATVYNLKTNQSSPIFRRASNIHQMKRIVDELNERYAFEDYTMKKYNHGRNLSDYDKIAWEAGNRGINAGAYLHNLIEEEIKNPAA